MGERSLGASEGEGSLKAQKGLIRVRLSLRDERLVRPSISGDFFMYPEDSLWDLEKVLEGCTARRGEVEGRVQAFYRGSQVVTPGVNPQDFVEAVMRAVADFMRGEKRPKAADGR